LDEPLSFQTRDAADIRADIRAGHAPGRPMSTGVGLANIRNRLMQAYGATHLFETRSEAGGGFTVLIEIPFTRDDVVQAEPAALPVSGPAAAGQAAPEQGGNIVPLNPPQRIIGTPA
jgi:hypothetical protein